MTLKDLKHKGHRESPRRGRCHICEAVMFSPARLGSLKIQLPVPGLPHIAVVCPRPRAHLSISELSRPRQWGPAGHIGAPRHPCDRQRILGVFSCLSSLAPSPASQALPPQGAVRKPGEALSAAMEGLPRYLVTCTKQGAAERRPCLLLGRGRDQ